MNIYFLRHGQSIGNLTNDYGTSFHGHLSEKGLMQAEALVERLKGIKFDHIFVSPIERAVYTILPYLKANNIIAELWGELSEACYQKSREGELPENVRYGHAIKIAEDDMRFFKYRDNDAHRAFPPSPENYLEGIRRIRWIYEHLIDNYGKSNLSILLVGHAHAGSRLIEMFLDMEPIGSIQIDNTGLCKISYSKVGIKVAFLNRK